MRLPRPSPARASFAAALALAAALRPAGTAAAAEAYLCDNNRVVYVEVEDLERLIRTDACIARYHGIDLAAPSRDSDRLIRLTSPLTELSPSVTSAAAAPPSAPAAEPKPALGSSQLVRAGAQRSHAAAPLSPVPVQAAPGTDYQNVRVINAGDEAGRWFRLPR